MRRPILRIVEHVQFQFRIGGNFTQKGSRDCRHEVPSALQHAKPLRPVKDCVNISMGPCRGPCTTDGPSCMQREGPFVLDGSEIQSASGVPARCQLVFNSASYLYIRMARRRRDRRLLPDDQFDLVFSISGSRSSCFDLAV